MTKIFRFFPLFILSVLFVFSGSRALHADIIAEGTAAIFGGNVSAAKEQALKNAQRNAIEQGIGVYIDSSTLQENWRVVQDKIYSSAQGYIQDYEILEEGKTGDGNSWYVKINAVISDQILENDLRALDILHKKAGNIRYVISPRSDSQNTEPGLESSVMSAFSQKLNRSGFRLFEPGDSSRFDKLSREQKFEVLRSRNVEMLVEFEITFFGSDSNSKSLFKSITYNVRGRAYNVSTGEILSSVESAQKHFVKPSASLNSQAVKAEAVKKSAEVVAGMMISDLVKSYQKADESGNTFTIIFQNYTSEQESLFTKLLQEMDGREGLRELKKIQGLLSLEYSSRLPLIEIRRRLEEGAKKEQVRLKVKVSFGKRLVYVNQ